MNVKKNKGYLLVMMQPPPAFEDEFNAWYDTEHIPERVAVPGFETGIRYVCVNGFPRFLAMYDTQDPEVLASPEYLRVSFDKSSPWTKRVTSRVKVDRSAGVQIYPGNKITGRAPRALLLRFRGLDTAASDRIVAGLRANYEGRPETIQLRVFTNVTATETDYFGFVELRAPIGEQVDLGAFGAHADALDLVNSYAAY
jgi:hypothetical protein